MRRVYRNGFSLAEVVIAFVLISLLGVIVAGVVTASYRLSAQLHELPNAYYSAQDQVEKELDALKEMVKEKFRIQNELTNTPPGEIQSALVDRLNEVNASLGAYRSRNATLFGKSVDVFEFTYTQSEGTGTGLVLYAGAANAESLERPVPIIDQVLIKAAGGGVVNELYHAAGTVVNATVQYNSKNYSYHFRDLYQWYVCTGDFHTTAYGTGRGYEEVLYGTVFAQYPHDFTLIPGATGASLTVDASYAGKFLVCVATPLSIEGKMGESCVSNFLYISALPSLSTGTYLMTIEPSLTTFNYDPSGFVSVDQIQSRTPTASRLVSVGGRRAEVSLNGSVTDSIVTSSLTGRGNYSRYLKFEPGCVMRASGLPSRGGVVAFAVARSGGGAVDDFMASGTETAGFATNSYMLGMGGDSGWLLLAADLSEPNNFVIGGQYVDVAELILVGSPSPQDTAAVLSYLAKKYHIS